MHTVMTTNNGYDSILLVDDNDIASDERKRFWFRD